jgi:hypothetical protein
VYGALHAGSVRNIGDRVRRHIACALNPEYNLTVTVASGMLHQTPVLNAASKGRRYVPLQTGDIF